MPSRPRHAETAPHVTSIAHGGIEKASPKPSESSAAASIVVPNIFHTMTRRCILPVGEIVSSVPDAWLRSPKLPLLAAGAVRNESIASADLEAELVWLRDNEIPIFHMRPQPDSCHAANHRWPMLAYFSACFVIASSGRLVSESSP